jgi:hypothetical protein
MDGEMHVVAGGAWITTVFHGLRAHALVSDDASGFDAAKRLGGFDG